MAKLSQPQLPQALLKSLSPAMAQYLALQEKYIASLEARIKALEP